MVKKILLCGDHSFVATGLYDKLKTVGFQVDCFSRGKEGRNEDRITGDVYQMASNPLLDSQYDIVINFILIKNHSIDKNLQYVKELVSLCRTKSVRRLIHISSVIVYENNEYMVNEQTAIEEGTDKGGYGAVKIAVDNYLTSLKDLPFKLTFIRPGYVLTEDTPVPFVKKLPASMALLKGNKKSMQAVVQRDDIHKAIINMIKLNSEETVYLFVPSDNLTKYEYAKERFNYHFLFLPKWIILSTARLFLMLRLIDKTFYKRVEGMYVETKYDSSKTEKCLNIKF